MIWSRLAAVALVVAAACSAADTKPTSSQSAIPTTVGTSAPQAPVATTAAESPAPTSSTVTTTAETTSIWQGVVPMRFPRSEMPGVTIADRIYVAGGFLRDASGGVASADVVEVYEPTADEWLRSADMPGRRHHLMASELDGVLYVIGGFDDEGPTATTWAIAPGSNDWQVRSPIPVAVAAAGAASLDGWIYVVGGVPGGDSAWRYRPSTDEWEALPPLSEPREHTAVVAYRGRIYAIGGRWRGVETATVEVFDPLEQSWSAAAPLNRPRGGLGATVWLDRIVVAGGEVLGREDTLTSVEAYAASADTWIELEPMPVALHGLAVAAVGDRLYALGGSRKAGAVENAGDALVRGP